MGYDMGISVKGVKKNWDFKGRHSLNQKLNGSSSSPFLVFVLAFSPVFAHFIVLIATSLLLLSSLIECLHSWLLIMTITIMLINSNNHSLISTFNLYNQANTLLFYNLYYYYYFTQLFSYNIKSHITRKQQNINEFQWFIYKFFQ